MSPCLLNYLAPLTGPVNSYLVSSTFIWRQISHNQILSRPYLDIVKTSENPAFQNNQDFPPFINKPPPLSVRKSIVQLSFAKYVNCIFNNRLRRPGTIENYSTSLNLNLSSGSFPKED